MTMAINVSSIMDGTAAPKVDLDVAAVKQSAAKDAELDRRSIIQAVEKSEKSAQQEEKASDKELEHIVKDLSDMMTLMRKGLAFKIDKDSGINIVSVMDVESGELIRQIPNEEALELAQKLSEVTGLLMKTEA